MTRNSGRVRLHLALLCAVFGGTALFAAGGAAAAAVELPKCGAGTTANCIEQILKDGVAVPYPSDPVVGSDDWDVFATREDIGGARYFDVSIFNDLGTLTVSDVWSVKINTGSTYPGEMFARGQDVTVTRSTGGGPPYTVTVTLSPVEMAYDGCTSSGACGEFAGEYDPAQIRAVVNDSGYRSDPDDALAMRGFDLATNTDWVSSPLELDYATNTILLDVANAHRKPLSEGGGVFRGQAEFRLPNAMLRRLYNVDDPPSLTPASFAVRGMGGAATTLVAVDGSGVHVDIDGMTFSKRKLKIEGKTHPRKPGNLRAKRKTAVKAKITSSGAKPRGSKVRGYKAVCRPGRGAKVRAETTRRDPLPIWVKGLTPGKRYVCTVRAKSRAGLGTAGKVSIPRRP